MVKNLGGIGEGNGKGVGRDLGGIGAGFGRDFFLPVCLFYISTSSRFHIYLNIRNSFYKS